MTEKAIQVRSEELLTLGKALVSDPKFSDASQLLNGAIYLTEICYGATSTQCSGLIYYRDKLINAPQHEQQPTMVHAIHFTIGALESLQSELKAGLIGNLNQQIAGEVLGDLIQLAKAALSEKKPDTINVAAVLVAASYEDAIRRMGSQLAGILDRPKLEKVIGTLKKEGHLKGAQVSTALGYLPFRNDALHADWDKIEQSTVHSCLSFVEQLLLIHFS